MKGTAKASEAKGAACTGCGSSRCCGCCTRRQAEGSGLGKKGSGSRTPLMALILSTPNGRSCMSATTKPMPLRLGQANDYPPKPNGSMSHHFKAASHPPSAAANHYIRADRWSRRLEDRSRSLPPCLVDTVRGSDRGRIAVRRPLPSPVVRAIGVTREREITGKERKNVRDALFVLNIAVCLSFGRLWRG